LPDGGSKGDVAGTPTFWGRINKQSGGVPNYDHWKQDNIEITPAPVSFNFGTGQADVMFFTRMLYSALVDADFLDTEEFMRGEDIRNHIKFDADSLLEKLNQYTAGWFPPNTDLNLERCRILTRCIEQGRSLDKGLFTLTVPTGGGKTIASLAFALNSAKRNQQRRIIYVVPYTSIIEQTAKVFRSVLGEENVLEHHSGVVYNDSLESDNMLRATENWDMPIVVTTAVQFFESLYSNKSSQCRKLHNITNSVVIFDEAQMLPVPYVKPCVSAITHLVSYYGVTAVLCTATQPALDNLIRKMAPDLEIKDICDEKDYDLDRFKRTSIEMVGKKSWEELACELNAHDQALCIVNSRKGAQKLFSLIEDEGSYHLSTTMFPAHRIELLDEIRQKLKDGEKCRVVATSLIEAGVDVDFPVVYREENGLDSILQAAGRCNREGKRNWQESKVFVFSSEERVPPMFDLNISAMQVAVRNQEDIQNQEVIHQYFKHLFCFKGDAALDQMKILELSNSRQVFMPFAQVASMFHIIDSNTRTVYIPVNDGKFLTEKLKMGAQSRTLWRELGRYGVGVYDKQYEALLNRGALYVIDDEMAILEDLSCYSDRIGLRFDTAESGALIF